PEVRMNAAVWRYHPRMKTFEIFAEGTSNPWGMDWRNTDGQFILCCCVIPHLFHIVPGGIYKRQAGASFNPYAYGYLNEICDHTFHKESGWAHAGLISLDTPHIPEKYRNSVIFGSIHGCSIKRNVLKPNGSTFTASRADDFLQSGDKNFRPINMKWGPLGDIYLIDWHDQNPCHQTNPDDWDYVKGRVYRIQLKGTQPKKAEDLGKKSDVELAKMAVSGEPYHARMALKLLWERERGKLGHDVQQGKWITDDSARVAFSIRVGLGQLDRGEAALDKLIQWCEKETNPSIRRELASTAIWMAKEYDITPMLHALLSHKEDATDPVIPQLVWLAYEKNLARRRRTSPEPKTKTPAPDGAGSPVRSVAAELTWLAEQAPNNPFVRDSIVPKVMRRLVATGKADDLQLCLGFVAKLKDTPSRERALGGLATALTGQTVNAPAGWKSLESELRKEPKLIHLVDRLAVSFRDPAAVKRAILMAADPDLRREVRIEAVRQIGLLKPAEGLPVLLKMAASEHVNTVRAEAVRALAAFTDPRIPTALLASWKDLPKELRGEVVNTLSSRKEWARALLQAMAAKKIDRTAVTDNTILRIQAFRDGELNKLIEKAWGRTRPTPKELAATIDKTRASLAAAPGSFARGKIVFENTCGKCHKFDGKGPDVGPALDGAARDIEYILVNVIDPNRVIGAPYFLRIARLQDGTVQQGVLAEEDDKFVSLKQENGVVKKIARADLEGPLQTVEKSLMPEGLGYNLSPQDFRDLVRYAMANPFLTNVSVNGKKQAVGVPGRIVVSQSKQGTTIEAEFESPEDMKTKLLIGSSADFEVRIDGKPIGSGKGTGKDVQPDQAAFDVAFTKGKHTVAILVKGSGLLYARFADPDRKLRYPE
ncbi:MAG TPA: PVC-type heme-binding CxxCH protein, partial [Urbifossiella sp.]|nr:PVC-type heme-binding CxxCH protein [Urbifossiella sp.]